MTNKKTIVMKEVLNFIEFNFLFCKLMTILIVIK